MISFSSPSLLRKTIFKLFHKRPRTLRTFSTISDRSIMMNDLKSRSMIADSTDEFAISSLLSKQSSTSKKSLSIYCGYDPTADSLHVGNLVTIIALRKIASYGLEPIAIVGTATGQIGDPSGKSSERSIMAQEILSNNSKRIGNLLSNLLSRPLEGESEDDGESVVKPKVLFNGDWYASTSIFDFMRDVGRYFRVNNMLTKDSVKARLDSGEGMSFTEFSYSLFQAYDFLYLFENHNTHFQLGGSDQWGNVTAGIHLIKAKLGNHVEPHALTVPLLTTSTGEKFGKSAGNAIWLHPDRTSPYELYQFLLQTTDEDVSKLLLRLTLLPTTQVESILSQHASSPEQRHAQHSLAAWVTRFVHGQEGLQEARAATELLFSGSIDSISSLHRSQLDRILKAIPRTNYSSSGITLTNQTLLDIMVINKIIGSKGEGRRLIKGGGISINGAKILDPSQKLNLSAHTLTTSQDLILFKIGKKKFHLLSLS